MAELKELSVDELLRLKEKLVNEVEELKTWLKQMAEVKKSINVLVNSNESLQNRIRMEAEKILMLTKEAEQNRHNEAMLTSSNEKLISKIEVLTAKITDIALISYSVVGNPANQTSKSESTDLMKTINEEMKNVIER